MGDKSGIQWTDASWNPTRGCTRVSAGCVNCYAERQAHRMDHPGGAYEGLTKLVGGEPRWNGTVRLVPEMLDLPLRWKRPRRVFVDSMSDLFHPDVPDEYIDRVFAVMALAPQHTYQILTKRPERMAEYLLNAACQMRVALAAGREDPHSQEFDTVLDGPWPLPNVWCGTSCEDQAAFDQRAHWLAKTPAVVRFFSLEPLIGPINWSAHTVSIPWAGGEARGGCDYSILMDFIHWVIVGGESGPGARPCDIDWIRSIVAQCREAGVACFVKQLGSYAVLDSRYDRTLPGWTRKLRDRKGGDIAEFPEDLRVREYPHGLQVA